MMAEEDSVEHEPEDVTELINNMGLGTTSFEHHDGEQKVDDVDDDDAVEPERELVPEMEFERGGEPSRGHGQVHDNALEGVSNGHHHVDEGNTLPMEGDGLPQGEGEGGEGEEEVNRVEPKTYEEMEWELNRTREDKQVFEDKYNGLLNKLTMMRNTLGDKLKQDADELDRREQEINELRLSNDDLSSTIETLKTELIQAHQDSEKIHSELETMRFRIFDSQKGLSEEANERELALREAQDSLERIRIERDEWEQEAMRERVAREQFETKLGALELELGQCKADRDAYREARDREAESAANLHNVLEEFQAAKDVEIRSTLGDLQAQLDAAHDSLGLWKQRANTAETNLAAAQNDSEKVITLSKELKEKTLLTGKLRHEAVILNEHLTEALRRLKKDSSENSVDRRLVSNVLISFLNTPRGDTKRFEMLQLLASILSWTDDQREQVGLQRSALSASTGRKGHSRSGVLGGGKGRERSTTTEEEDGLGENESFSNLFIEFLLKEANQAAPANKKGLQPPASPTASGVSSPTSPRSPGFSPSIHNQRFNLPELASPPSNTRRPSFTSYFTRGSSQEPAPVPAVSAQNGSSQTVTKDAIQEEP